MLKILNFFRFLCHSWGKTQSLTPQAELNLLCVLYFSPQALTWSKLLTSLVALLEAGKFHNSPIKLTMLWGAFAVRSLFDLMCSTQHKPGLQNICCSCSPRGCHAGGFFLPPVQSLDTNTSPFAVSSKESSSGLGSASMPS